MITADLLRYLQRREQLLPPAGEADRLVQLGHRLGAKHVRLLTCGSPLRQLYALRFPCLYSWVLGPHGRAATVSGPDPRGDLGVAHWVNVWAAGDYVGRWLWTAATDPALPALAVDPVAFDGKPAQRAPDYRDLCLGADAHTHTHTHTHTHYFDLDNTVMLAELRTLV